MTIYLFVQYHYPAVLIMRCSGLKSIPSTGVTVKHVKELHLCMLKGGFNFWEVLELIPVEATAKDFKEIDLDNDVLPTERALGIWFVEMNMFGFKVNIKEKPCAGRGILSVVSLSARYGSAFLSFPQSYSSKIFAEMALVGVTRIPATTYLGGGCGLTNCQNLPLSQLKNALSRKNCFK